MPEYFLFVSPPYIFIAEMVAWLSLDAVTIYSSGLERDVSSLTSLWKILPG